jgi:hypothetical protein
MTYLTGPLSESYLREIAAYAGCIRPFPSPARRAWAFALGEPS